MFATGGMTQDWNRMLKSFRTKTYRNLQEDPAAAAAANAAAVAVSTTSTVDWIGSKLFDRIFRHRMRFI